MNITGLLFCCWLRSRSSCSSLVGCGFVCASFVESLCGRLRLRGSFLASWLMVRGRCHRSTGRWFATKCSASVSGVCSATIVASTARRCSPIPLCDALDSAPSQWTFTSRPVWLQLKIFVTFTRNFPSRVLMTLVSFCMHAGCSSRAFEFYVAWGFLFTCSCAHSLSTECGRLVDLALCLVWWNFLAALVLSLSVCCRLEILQHLTWRLSGCLLEVCIIASGDDLRSARGRASICSRPCCESSSGPSVLTFALLESLQFAARPWSLPESLRHHIDKKFSGRPHFTWTFSLEELEDANFGLYVEITLSSCKWASVSGSKGPVSQSSWWTGLIQIRSFTSSLFAGETGIIVQIRFSTILLCFALIVLMRDRHQSSSWTCISLTFMDFSDWTLISSVFHYTSTCAFTVPEAKPNSLIGFPSPSLSVSLIHNYLCADSAGNLMCSVSWIDLLLGDKYVCFLAVTLMIQEFAIFDCVDWMLLSDKILSSPSTTSSWICGFENPLRYHVSVQVSVSTCFLKTCWSQDLVFVVLSFVGRRVVEAVAGHPRPSLLDTGAPWVSCLDPPVCHNPGWLCGKEPTHRVCWLESWHRVFCALVFECSALMCNWEHSQNDQIWFKLILRLR